MPVDSYQVQPGQGFVAVIGGMPDETGRFNPSYFPPNLPAGSVGVQVIPVAGGGAVIPRLTTPREQLANSAVYAASLTAPPVSGDYTVLWDDNAGAGPFLSQTLQVGTSLAPTVGSEIPGDGLTEQKPVYITPCTPGSPPTNTDLEACILGLAVDNAEAMDLLIVKCEWEIDSILGTWRRNPATGRKINTSLIIPVEPVYYVSNYLFAPFQQGVTIYQLHALRRAVAAQVEYHLKMGEDFFARPQYPQVSGPQFSRTGVADRIAPGARQALAGTGLVRMRAHLTV